MTSHENEFAPGSSTSTEDDQTRAPEVGANDLETDDDSDDDADEPVSQRGVACVLQYETFEDANLDPRLTAAISGLGWKTPTPIQSLCLPHALGGRDVAGFAQTGTGKTAVFLLTTAQKLLSMPERPANAVNGVCNPFAVVLCPTRELAMQITQDAEQLLNGLEIKTLAVFGGIDYDKQASILKRGVDVIMATPGRLKDYYERKLVTLDSVQLFVCDEVDRMFDMGFISDVEFFMSRLPEEEPVQKLIFSATTNDDVKELAFKYLDNPEYIAANPEIITPETIEQHFVIADAPRKLKVLLGLIEDQKPERGIIFTNTKLTAEWLHFKLVNNGVEADLITGDLPQRKRINLINKIKEGQLKFLIATDVASRGLHIKGVTHVYNFDLPEESANYVHRIGRTARAGARGSAYSLVCEDYGENLRGIETLLGDSMKVTCEWYDTRYESIEDKAGNPFEGRVRNARGGWEQQSEGSMTEGNDREGRRGGHHHPRGPRPPESAGAGKGAQEGRRAQGGAGRREREGQRRQGEEGRHEHRHGHKSHDGKHHDKHHEQRGDAHQGDDRGGRRRRRRGRGRGQDQAMPVSAAKPIEAKSGILSVGGLLKKIFGALIGKK